MGVSAIGFIRNVQTLRIDRNSLTGRERQLIPW
jgi:hypothetical protein